MDLGSALAGLRYRALVDDEAARGERVRSALLAGYASARELPDRADLAGTSPPPCSPSARCAP